MISCSICLQIMTHPCVSDCQGAGGVKHVFGINCINQWIQRSGKKCPLCRNSFKKLSYVDELAEEAGKLKATCKECEVVLPIMQINAHFKICKKRIAQLNAQLAEVVQHQFFLIQKQINPHLRQCHAQIYNTYVKQWNWLYSDTRNWKWWWWCSNPWWQNKSCPQCNLLWHKYQIQIDCQEDKRIGLLKELNPDEEDEEQKGEEVKCKNA